jgi:glycerophosphoryl diester phosphodiesterase
MRHARRRRPPGRDERYVENTRNAFRDAANVGAKFWETDVRFTADDVPVIMHDETVDRTTTGTGDVADLTYAQWQTLRTSDDQPLPSLADVMNDQSVDRAYAFVELKTMPTEAQWATFIAALTSRVAAGTPRPVIESFDPAILDQVAVRLPAYTRALIQSTGDADPADITPHATILLKHHDSITASAACRNGPAPDCASTPGRISPPTRRPNGSGSPTTATTPRPGRCPATSPRSPPATWHGRTRGPAEPLRRPEDFPVGNAARVVRVVARPVIGVGARLVVVLGVAVDAPVVPRLGGLVLIPQPAVLMFHARLHSARRSHS